MHHLVTVLLGMTLLAPTALAETPQETAERLQWWTDARFGMFIHWGPVSLKGTEIGWSRGVQVPVEEYDALYKQFNPTGFDAAEWVSLAKAAGMKYIVITSKHHDGFSIFDSAYTDYDIMSTPFGRDVLRELADECEKQGIRLCTYYSIIDWYHPDYIPRGKGDTRSPNTADFENYVTFMKNQLRELTENYGPLGILWFDGEWEETWTNERGQDLYRYVRGLQPDIIINNRVDVGREGMKGVTKTGNFAGDYDTPEQTVGAFNRERPWESCITICNQWAWKPNDRMKSLKQCLRTLIYACGGDGNLLFNVGPMPDGRIEPRQVDRLREMGDWMDLYGETIYGTHGGPFKPGDWGASTCKDNTIYLHVFEWGGDTLKLPPLDATISDASLLTGGKVKVKQTDKGITVRVNKKQQDPIDTIVKLEMDGAAFDIPPVDVKTE